MYLFESFSLKCLEKNVFSRKVLNTKIITKLFSTDSYCMEKVGQFLCLTLLSTRLHFKNIFNEIKGFATYQLKDEKLLI